MEGYQEVTMVTWAKVIAAILSRRESFAFGFRTALVRAWLRTKRLYFREEMLNCGVADSHIWVPAAPRSTVQITITVLHRTRYKNVTEQYDMTCE